MKRFIRKVAVLGSGVMGSRIACHFANVGCEVLLLDISPKELDAVEAKKGLTLESKAVRNRIVNQSLQFALKSNPSPIYLKSFATRIETGNFDDDLHFFGDMMERGQNDYPLAEAVKERLGKTYQVKDWEETRKLVSQFSSTFVTGLKLK